ncbi:putative nuclease HARBI1 isoform X1 [Ixodes scapularis]
MPYNQRWFYDVSLSLCQPFNFCDDEITERLKGRKAKAEINCGGMDCFDWLYQSLKKRQSQESILPKVVIKHHHYHSIHDVPLEPMVNPTEPKSSAGPTTVPTTPIGAWTRGKTHGPSPDEVMMSDVDGAFDYSFGKPEPVHIALERLYREHRDAFELPEEIFRKQYRLPKIVVRWLCDELREEPEVRRVRTSWTVMTVELQVLCALRFYGTGSFQGMVASDEHVARDQKTVSVAVRAVSVAIVRRLGVQRGWIHFPETPSERFDAEKGFRLLGRIPGVIGCVDGTMVSIVGPSKNDPTVTKAAYWCRKYFYALNVMVVCDADCRIMCIDPRYPGSVHDSFVWQFSWLRNQLEQGQVPRDGRFLLGDSGYPLEPWLITPVPGNHATSTACGRFNKAHSSISAPQHLPCIERARTGVRLRP